jgi:hypothetical protein
MVNNADQRRIAHNSTRHLTIQSRAVFDVAARTRQPASCRHPTGLRLNRTRPIPGRRILSPLALSPLIRTRLIDEKIEVGVHDHHVPVVSGTIRRPSRQRPLGQRHEHVGPGHIDRIHAGQRRSPPILGAHR